MANPYYNDIGNLRSSNAVDPHNSHMKQQPTQSYSPSHLSPLRPPPLPGQHQSAVTSSAQYNAMHSHQSNNWQAGHSPTPNIPPPRMGHNVNGLPPSSEARGSPQQFTPPPNTFSPGRDPNAQMHPPQMTPPGGFPNAANVPFSAPPSLSSHYNAVGSHVRHPPLSTPGLLPPTGTPPLPPGANMPPRSAPPPFGSTHHPPGGFTSGSNAPPSGLPLHTPQIGGTPTASLHPNVPSSLHQSAAPTMFQPPNKNQNATSAQFNQNSPMPPTSGFIPSQNPPRYPPSVNHTVPPPDQHQLPPAGNQMQRQPPLHPAVHQPNFMPPHPAPGQYPFPPAPGITQGMGNLGIDDRFRPVNLMQEKRIVPLKKHRQKPLHFKIRPGDRGLISPNRKNCSPEVFRCTLNAIPNTQALLNKVKLPLGLIIHPFKDLSSLPVISAGTIVRCKRCRTYINPFVDFLDERRWKCNLCFVVNDIPEEFLHHPVSKTYGEPHTRPECTNSTLEFIAPQEYMVRPPQPAVYMFLFDVSHAAVETGYLQIVCDALLDHIDHLPGDARTKIGFVTYNGTVHFYRMAEGASQPQMLIVSDLDDIFLPTPDSLLVNLRERKELVCDLLRQLPEIHEMPDNLSRGEIETQSALGAALQAAQKMMAAFGGRVTVFQQCMPTTGPGALKPRENPNSRAGDSSKEFLNPSTDFYKKLALDSSAHQIAMDFFFMNSQFIDIATLSCASRFSAGDLHYYPGLHVTHNPIQVERLSRDLDRYLTRKIGFEAVMRIRCTKGLAIHTFHGNFFVRSTDLLALANINPDAGFGLNLSIEDNLTDMSSVCIQAALLYTSSKGERRIRVHTMCFPVAKHLNEVFNSVDSDAVVSLLSKMAVDRSITASISDARDALVNAVIDALKAYKETVNPGSVDNSLLVPPCMRTFPLAISCLLKHPAIRSGISTRLDDRVFSMVDLKMQPAVYSLLTIHPDLYRVDDLTDEGALDIDERVVPQPQLLPLSAESISRDGAYLLDTGWHLYLHVNSHVSQEFLQNVLGVKQFSDIEQPLYSLPDLDNPQSESFNSFVEWLQDQRPHYAPMQVVRADSREHYFFMLHMRQDKTESSMSFQEFLQHVKQQMTK